MQRQRRRWLTCGLVLAVSATLAAGHAKFAGADPYKGAVEVRKDGSELLYVRKNEIVKNGTVVGRFDGNKVRRDGSIVGEIRGDVFYHEGTEVWKLDQGNLYRGIEVRWDGSILGDVRADGTIWWEGSRWGSLKPYKATRAETMRLVVALYYFSDYFKRK